MHGQRLLLLLQVPLLALLLLDLRLPLRRPRAPAAVIVTACAAAACSTDRAAAAALLLLLRWAVLLLLGCAAAAAGAGDCNNLAGASAAAGAGGGVGGAPFRLRDAVSSSAVSTRQAISSSEDFVLNFTRSATGAMGMASRSCRW